MNVWVSLCVSVCELVTSRGSALPIKHLQENWKTIVTTAYTLNLYTCMSTSSGKYY